MDMKLDTKSQLEMSRSTLGFEGINDLKAAAQKGDSAALEEAAKQFEAIFVKMLLSSMRKAQDAIADEDSPFNSEQVKFYRDMHDQQLSTNLSTNGSMGLAEIIVNQLDPTKSARSVTMARSDANLEDIYRYQALAKERANTILENNVTANPVVQKQAAFENTRVFLKMRTCVMFPIQRLWLPECVCKL